MDLELPLSPENDPIVVAKFRAEPDALVVVVEDDELVQRALLRLLRTAGYAVEGFSSVESYLERFVWEAPACLVLDLHLPAIGGLELLERLEREQRALPTIVITGHGNVPTTVRAMKAGACEFLEKPFDNHQLLAAVEVAVARGRKLRRSLVQKANLQTRLAHLTPRERQVLDLVVEGLPNKRIANRLEIAEKTIKVHRARVMEKMGAGSLAELVRLMTTAGVANG
jgi:RNA polymerase sigma factor (sigma-70 family)